MPMLLTYCTRSTLIVKQRSINKLILAWLPYHCALMTISSSWYHILVFYVSCIHFTINFGLFQSTTTTKKKKTKQTNKQKKQYFDDVKQFWKCVHWIPRVSKPLPYMLKYKCGMYYVFIKLSFCLVQSESSILMTSYSFEIMSIVFYGCPNPLYVEIQMWHVLWLHEIGIFASTNLKTVYWWRHRVLKMCSLKSTGAKTPYRAYI